MQRGIAGIDVVPYFLDEARARPLTCGSLGRNTQPQRPTLAHVRSTGQLVVDIRTNLRRSGIPLGLPVTVDLPFWPREAVIVGPAPLANGIVGGAEAAIRPEVRCRCHRAGGRCRTYNFALLGKRSMQLHAYLQPNAAIPIDSDMAASLRLLCAHYIPDQSTALGYNARKFGRASLATDYRSRHTLELLELNVARCHGTFSFGTWLRSYAAGS